MFTKLVKYTLSAPLCLVASDTGLSITFVRTCRLIDAPWLDPIITIERKAGHMGLILLRYGELALKGANRKLFIKRLRSNIRDGLKRHGVAARVESIRQRIYVHTDQVDQALDPLSRVFGLVSISPVAQVSRDMDAIVAECLASAEQAGVGPGVSYRVRSRRADKTFPHISPEIDRLCAEAISLKLGGRIDLSKAADVTIGVEVAREHALVFGRTIPAPGGLPVGSEGRVVALMSGGIDSPVAAWLMLKRGCTVIPVHFSQSDAEAAKALDNVERLAEWAYGWRMRPIVESHSEVIAPTLDRLRAVEQECWSCLFCKRAIIARAIAIALEHNAQAIVMGDSLGQVASQTLPNLRVVSYGAELPILRPLIGMDKSEIVDLARRIGTFDVSTRNETPCPFLPAHPITRGNLEKLIEIETALASLEDRPAAETTP